MTANRWNDGQCPACPKQCKIHQKSRHASIAIDEWMDIYKLLMNTCGKFNRIQLSFVLWHPLDELRYQRRDFFGSGKGTMGAGNENTDSSPNSCIGFVYLRIEETMHLQDICFINWFVFGDIIKKVVRFGM